MKAIFFSGILILTVIISAGAQENQNEKVKVYIHKQTGKIYSQNDIEGQENQRFSKVPRYIFKQTTDTTYFYLDEDYSGSINERVNRIETQNIDKIIDLGQLVDINGNVIDEDELNGKVVVVNFWGPWCPPCIKEIPELNQLVESFTKQDVIFIAPAVKTNREKILNFLDKKEFNYRIIPDAEELSAKFTMHYPTNVVIDKNGAVKFVKVGYDSSILDILTKEINALL